MSAISRITWSADVPDESAVLKKLGQMPSLEIVKIDRLFTDCNGRNALTTLRERGLNVFYDAKFVEIPSKLEELAKKAVKHKPWMLNCMAGSLSNGDMSVHEDRDLMDGLKRFADVCHAAGTLPCGVTVLTSKTDKVISQEFSRSGTAQVMFYLDRLIEAGFEDVVCSPVEAAELLTRPRYKRLRLHTPGVRFEGTDADDQPRTATPGGAIRAGVATVVMGRPLTKGDSAANLARAVAEIELALAT